MDEMKFPGLNLLSGCNILITGATGLIGSELVRALMSQSEKYGFVVYAMGRNADRAETLFSEYVSRKDFHFIKHDIVRPLTTATDYHYIIHLASGASPNVMTSSPVDVMRANFIGTDNLLSYGIEHNMKRFLFVSSGEIYGECGGEAVLESDGGYVDSMHPRNCYPSSKRAAETLCVSYMTQYGADVVVARPCHVYGASFTEKDNRAYAQFIRNAINGENIVLKSSGMQYRSWLYVKDCVSALLYILMQGECGQAYNVADENSCLTIKDLAEVVAGIAGREVIVSEPPAKELQGPKITRAVFNTRKLRALGWEPEYSLYSAMSEIYQDCNNA